ncbi:MAG: amino acid adenylation domain-containing protein, partial [bacterium]|nr:amino acid adenylation domain-containing protein [bacterium]
MGIAIEYCTKLFKKETIERIAGYFKKILPQITVETERKIAEIEIISQQERTQLLYQFNETANLQKNAGINSEGKTVIRLIEEQTARTPDRVALVGTNHPGETTTLPCNFTYRQLNEKANRLARELRRLGLQNGTIAGIMVKRSPGMVVAILAILKAGGTYLPIDPVYPPQRKQHMITDSAAAILVVQGENNNDIGTGEIEKIDITADTIYEQDSGNLEPETKPHDLIYIIYTSGSTGKPKGAAVYHKSFTNLVNWYITEFELNRQDSVLMMTSLSFDLTQKNIYAPLIVGGTLNLPGSDYFEPHILLDTIREKRITALNCTPQMFGKLVEENMTDLSGLRYVFLGGEPVSAHIILKWRESGKCNAKVVNTYGPTECTDVCTYYRITRPHDYLKRPVPIGCPVYETQLYVLDQTLKPVPVGVSGELCIGGIGTGPGYINQPALTHEKFVNAPGINQRIYKTGDLAKWLENGNIEFIGRIDRQVKIRGY